MEPHFPPSPPPIVPDSFLQVGLLTPFVCFVLSWRIAFIFKIDLTMYIRLALNMGSSCLSLLRDRSQSWLRVQAGWGSSFPEINWRAGVPWRTGIYLVKSQRVAVGSAMIYVWHASFYPFPCVHTHAYTCTHTSLQLYWSSFPGGLFHILFLTSDGLYRITSCTF